jgi:uncharacterized OsmC-like protein
MATRPRASGVTTGVPGRFVMSTRSAHIVSDATTRRGGAGEAFVAQELFLASLATCALAVIDDEARKAGVRPRISVEVESEIDPDQGPGYRAARLAFRFEGVAQEQAETFVAAFVAVCPIYYTLARTTPVTITVAAA